MCGGWIFGINVNLDIEFSLSTNIKEERVKSIDMWELRGPEIQINELDDYMNEVDKVVKGLREIYIPNGRRVNFRVCIF
jgi:hypothetical protein